MRALSERSRSKDEAALCALRDQLQRLSGPGAPPTNGQIELFVERAKSVGCPEKYYLEFAWAVACGFPITGCSGEDRILDDYLGHTPTEAAEKDLKQLANRSIYLALVMLRNYGVISLKDAPNEKRIKEITDNMAKDLRAGTCECFRRRKKEAQIGCLKHHNFSNWEPNTSFSSYARIAFLGTPRRREGKSRAIDETKRGWMLPPAKAFSSSMAFSWLKSELSFDSRSVVHWVCDQHKDYRNHGAKCEKCLEDAERSASVSEFTPETHRRVVREETIFSTMEFVQRTFKTCEKCGNLFPILQDDISNERCPIDGCGGEPKKKSSNPFIRANPKQSLISADYNPRLVDQESSWNYQPTDDRQIAAMEIIHDIEDEAEMKCISLHYRWEIDDDGEIARLVGKSSKWVAQTLRAFEDRLSDHLQSRLGDNPPLL